MNPYEQHPKVVEATNFITIYFHVSKVGLAKAIASCVADIVAEQDAEIARLRDSHRAQIAALLNARNAEVAAIMDEHREEVERLKSQIREREHQWMFGVSVEQFILQRFQDVSGNETMLDALRRWKRERDTALAEVDRLKVDVEYHRKLATPKTLDEMEAVNLRSIVQDQDADLTSLRSALTAAEAKIEELAKLAYCTPPEASRGGKSWKDLHQEGIEAHHHTSGVSTNHLARALRAEANVTKLRAALEITLKEVECYCTQEGIGAGQKGYPCAHCMAVAALAATKLEGGQG